MNDDELRRSAKAERRRVIESTDIDIQLDNSVLTIATQLDANGLAIKDLPLDRSSTGFSLTLPADAMYVLLR